MFIFFCNIITQVFQYFYEKSNQIKYVFKKSKIDTYYVYLWLIYIDFTRVGNGMHSYIIEYVLIEGNDDCFKCDSYSFSNIIMSVYI